MLRPKPLGAAALLIAACSSSPALAASFSPTLPSVVIRDSEPASNWEEKLPKQVAPAAPANGLLATSVGQASWYGPGFYGGRTANGEVFRPGGLTAAHRTLPFGTLVRVTNLDNGRSAVVRINDRGPFHGSRIIDLADGAAEALGVISSGIAQVRLERLD